MVAWLCTQRPLPAPTALHWWDGGRGELSHGVTEAPDSQQTDTRVLPHHCLPSLLCGCQSPALAEDKNYVLK